MTGTKRQLAELKLLAQPEMIATAKRTATSLGSLVGFSLDDLDELNIALAQACDSAIHAGREAWGDDATLKLTFWATDKGMEVDVQAGHPRVTALTSGRTVAPAGRIAARDAAFDRLAHEMIRCFVDDFRPSVAPNQGRVRFRLVKYRVG